MVRPDPRPPPRQDVSRLVDVCRQSIVYASLTDLAAGLDAIASDPAVRLVRVKNRLSPGYSAVQSAGYSPLSCASLPVESTDPEGGMLHAALANYAAFSSPNTMIAFALHLSL
jgi:hypothetical protein